jgi:hypothetical protein
MGEGQIVAGDDAQAGPRVERREHAWPQQRQAAIGHERGDDGDLGGASKERPDLGGEGIAAPPVASGGSREPGGEAP